MEQAKYRVVLVEDDASLRRLTRKVLEVSGRFEVVAEAGDGVTGIEAARRVQPELVLLDLAMPRMTGLEALPELRRAAPRAKVVALSMLRQEKHGPEALAHGAAAFIDKSVGSNELVRRLLTILQPDGGASYDGRPPGAQRMMGLAPTVRRWLDGLGPRPAYVTGA